MRLRASKAHLKNIRSQSAAALQGSLNSVCVISVRSQLELWFGYLYCSGSGPITNLVESQEKIGEILWNAYPDGVYHSFVGIAGLAVAMD